MIEDPADGAMLDAQFGSRDGNLYKPDGLGADWTQFSPEGFEKKTNERRADFSDVSEAIEALLAPQDDPAAWRAALEDTLDVDRFLRWLAVNTAVENWDAYGVMAHNYYLYGDPSQDGRLVWIPWDNNFALGARPPGMPPGAGPPPGMPRGMPMFGLGATDVLHSQTGDQWPLIQRLMADEVYAARYRQHLDDALDGLMGTEAVAARAREFHALIAPSVVGDDGERPTHTSISSPDAFERAIDGPGGLLEKVELRRTTIRTALDGADNR